MSARVIERASVVIPLRGRDMDVDAIVAEPASAAALRSALSEIDDFMANGPRFTEGDAVR